MQRQVLHSHLIYLLVLLCLTTKSAKSNEGSKRVREHKLPYSSLATLYLVAGFIIFFFSLQRHIFAVCCDLLFASPKQVARLSLSFDLWTKTNGHSERLFLRFVSFLWPPLLWLVIYLWQITLLSATLN